MKKIIFLLTFIITITTCVFASNVAVQINGEIVNFKDDQGNTVNAQMLNNRTMVPMRKIFEILGAQIQWDGENRIVTGVKDDVVIKLQIDNKTALKTVNGKEEEILLDTAPTIINNRTMVPLRFIAESLDKQVGWDVTSRTAIIIDYEYFGETLKTRAPALYSFFEGNLNNVECKVTHKYYDLLDESNNTSFIVKIDANIQNNVQDVVLTITGTDELGKEIMSEGWSETTFKLTYDEKDVLMNTDNAKLMEMLGSKETLKTYEELNITGKTFDNIFEAWANVNDNELNINTFSKLKNDFMKLCDLFATTNVSSTSLTSTSSPITYSSYKIEYFDLTKLDNFISDNEYLKLCNMVNKLFFKNDVLKDVILYDTTNILVKLSVNNNVFMATIQTENELKEKMEYIIEFKNV